LKNIPEYLQPIVDGFRIGVAIGYDAPTTISQSDPPLLNGEDIFDYSAGDAWWDSDNFNVCDFIRFGYANGTVNASLNAYVPGAGGTTDVNKLQQDLEFRWSGVVGDTTVNGNTISITKSGGSFITLIGATGYSLANHPLNPSPGTNAPFTIRVPFEVWNADNNVQINALMWDRSGNPTVTGGAVWNATNREYLWVVDAPYSPATIDAASQLVLDNGTWNVVFYKSNHTVGDVLKLTYDNPIQIGIDTYNFNPKAISYSNVDKAKNEVDKINVFPNPYYGVNTEELNKYNKFVTFSHLPTKATIRIFNLAGIHVRTIDKDDATQFQRWDLANSSGLPVASGLYLAYIDLPELGETKILKIAIIQEQQILDRF
jgi:hypothetical protein